MQDSFDIAGRVEDTLHGPIISFLCLKEEERRWSAESKGEGERGYYSFEASKEGLKQIIKEFRFLVLNKQSKVFWLLGHPAQKTYKIKIFP